jgi:outer membrane protein assembly factor BamB
MRRVPLLLGTLAVVLAGCSGSSRPATTAPTVTSSATTSPTAPGSDFPTTPASTPSQAALTDWPQYHGGPDRSGFADVAPLGPRLRVAWRRHVDGALYAQPIAAAGHVVAATENNTVYAVDPGTGAVRWTRHLVPPARRGDLPCGNIDPSGITGTPAYDGATHLLFVVTESTGARHVLWALDAGTGAVRWQRGLDVMSGRDRRAEQERGAVLVTGGRVVVAFGGRYGDCGNYVGYVVSVATDGSGTAYTYAIPTAREAGIWAAAGPVAGPGGDFYVASGNGAEVGGRYDGSDSVVRLSSTLHRQALFAPSVWPQDNRDDLDLGSMSPVVLRNAVVIAGKRGMVYLLRPTLGGVGGQVSSLDGCAGYGGAAFAGTTVLMPCDAGVRALDVSSTKLRWLWGPVARLGSPALARGVVYALDRGSGRLVKLDLATGKRRAEVAVGAVTRFATPAPVGDHVFVGTTNSLVAVVGSS